MEIMLQPGHITRSPSYRIKSWIPNELLVGKEEFHPGTHEPFTNSNVIWQPSSSNWHEFSDYCVWPKIVPLEPCWIGVCRRQTIPIPLHQYIFWTSRTNGIPMGNPCLQWVHCSIGQHLSGHSAEAEIPECMGTHQLGTTHLAYWCFTQIDHCRNIYW